MPGSAFYLGSELDRAVNRMDFFRLYKALALNHHCQYFLLSQVLGEEEEIDLQHAHCLYNLPDGNSLLLNSSGGSLFDTLLIQSRRFTAPFSLDFMQGGSPVIESGGFEAATVVPLCTTHVKRYCLMMFGDAGQLPRERLALIALEAALVFQRYDEAIISLDSFSALNDREIDIVRWTSEGKTSGEISIILGLSTHTVNSYIAVAMRKLDVVNRAQLVASALRNGLIG